MHRIEGYGHSENMFTEGDPASGVPATWVTADWANSVQEEIAQVIVSSSIDLSEASTDSRSQLLQAIKRLATSSVPNMAAFSNGDASGFKNKVYLSGFYSEGDGGEGLFHWQADEDKLNHNGGSIIDPDHASTPGETAWYSGDEEGSGCWVRDYSGPVNICWFGAQKSGGVDVSNIVQHVIASFSKVYAPKNEYIVEGVRLYAGSVLLGDGPDKTIFKPVTTSGDTTVFYTNPLEFCSYVMLKYFSIDANRTAGALLDSGLIQLENCHYFLLDTLTVFNPVCHAIMIHDCTRGVVKSCRAIATNTYTYDFDDGFAIGGASNNIRVEDCYTRGFNISGNQSGFEVDDGPTEITFEGCKAENCLSGFTAHTHESEPVVKNIRYNNCHSYQCTSGFRAHARASSYVRGLHYNNCVAEQISGSGFKFINSEGGPVSGVKLNKCTSDTCGVGIENETTDIQVSEHTMISNTTDYSNEDDYDQSWTHNSPEKEHAAWTPVIEDESGNTASYTLDFAHCIKTPNNTLKCFARMSEITTTGMNAAETLILSGFPRTPITDKWVSGSLLINNISYTDDLPVSYMRPVRIPTGVWFNTPSPYTTLSGASSDGFTAVSDGSATTKIAQIPDSVPLEAGKRYKISYDLLLNSGVAPQIYVRPSYGSGDYYLPLTSDNPVEFTAMETDTVVVCFRTESGDAADYTVSNFSVYENKVLLQSNKADGTSSDVVVSGVSSGTGAISLSLEYPCN